MKEQLVYILWFLFFPSVLPCKVKDKVHPRAGREGPEGEQRYSSTLSLTSVLDGVGDQRHPQERDPVPIL
jgi:hypothetical protein